MKIDHLLPKYSSDLLYRRKVTFSGSFLNDSSEGIARLIPSCDLA